MGDMVGESLDGDVPAADMRMLVLETTVAVIAARLPKDDLDELVSVLVLIAKGPDAIREGGDLTADVSSLTAAANHATALLERISKTRRATRL